MRRTSRKKRVKMRKNVKRWGLIFFCLIAGLFLMPNQSASAAITTSGLTASDAIITDNAGHTLKPGAEFSKWQDYQVTYNWSIPDDVSVTGDTATVELPAGLVAPSDLTIPLKNDQGEVIGTFKIASGATTGEITFVPGAATMKNRKGTLTIYAKGTTDNNIVGNDWAINKTGWISNSTLSPDGLPSLITWNVAFNGGSKDIGTITIIDTMSANQDFLPDTVVARTGHYDETGTFISDGGTITPTVSVSGKTVLTFVFPDVKTAVDMTYQAKPNATGSSQRWDNAAKTNGNDVTASISWGGSGTGNGDNEPNEDDDNGGNTEQPTPNPNPEPTPNPNPEPTPNPTNPVPPVKPETPGKPVPPVKPVTPTVPSKPETPETSGAPSTVPSAKPNGQSVNGSATGTSAQSNAPVNPGQPTTGHPATGANAQSATAGRLPQTGERSTHAGELLGLGLLGTLIGLAVASFLKRSYD